MKRLVIFDLDGTLLNTIDDLGTAANHALITLGYPPHPITAYPYFVGNGITRLLERVLPEDHRDRESVAVARKHFIEYYDRHLTALTKPYPGITELLRDLRANDINIAVASNKYQAAVETLVNHFFGDLTWAAIEGNKDDYPVKPDPSIVFDILGKCPTPKSEVLYVGDSGVDMETARRACVESVGVTWGFRPAAELRSHYADHIVNSPTDIFRLATATDM